MEDRAGFSPQLVVISLVVDPFSKIEKLFEKIVACFVSRA